MKTTKIDICSLPQNVREAVFGSAKDIKLVAAQAMQNGNTVQFYRVKGKTRTHKCYIEVTATGYIIAIKRRQIRDENKLEQHAQFFARNTRCVHNEPRA